MIKRRGFLRSVGSLAALLPFGLGRWAGAKPTGGNRWITSDHPIPSFDENHKSRLSIKDEHRQVAEEFMAPFVARYDWLDWHLSIISVSDSMFLNFYHGYCAFSIPDEPLQDCLVFGVRESPNGPMKLLKPTADVHDKVARLLARWDELGRLWEASQAG